VCPVQHPRSVCLDSICYKNNLFHEITAWKKYYSQIMSLRANKGSISRNELLEERENRSGLFCLCCFNLGLSDKRPVHEQEGYTLRCLIAVQHFPCDGTIIRCGPTGAGHTYPCWKGAVTLFQEHKHLFLKTQMDVTILNSTNKLGKF